MPYKKDHCHMLSMHTRMPDNMAWTLPVKKKVCLVTHEWTHMKTMGFRTPWWRSTARTPCGACSAAAALSLLRCFLVFEGVFCVLSVFCVLRLPKKQHNQTAAETIQAKSSRKNKGKKRPRPPPATKRLQIHAGRGSWKIVLTPHTSGHFSVDLS